MLVIDLIKKLQELPRSTIVVLQNPNTGDCKPIRGFESGRFQPSTKDFTTPDSVEENNSIILM